MAGIFANIDSDIDKLRKLKTEIEGVKKALTSINVKVDIDIANGLEAQLKNLTMQYDALARKVSEAEGKIMVSTQRINQAAEKIVKAQEQIMKTPEGQPQPAIKNDGNTSANKTETASIEAQAKAYDELAAEIDAVMGSRSQNIKRMVEEQNAIRLINEELKRMEKLNSTGTFSTNEIKRIEQLNGSLLKHKTALSELRQSLNNSFKLDNSAATSMNSLSQSLGRMRMAYRELTEEERKSPFGQELLASIQQADAKIKQLDATIGNYQRNVGNYASGFNGLNMSVQQIVRELPSATMGLNMFFLAISNNLPILTDEIKRAKAANEELKKSGKSGVPVWKQLVSSLFSWQSALMVGITVLTMYGDEIIDWVKNLISGKDSLKSLEESIEEVNEQFTTNSSTLANQIATYHRLQQRWKEANGDLEAQNRLIETSKGEFDKLGISITTTKDAEDAFVRNTSNVIEALKARAKASAARTLAEEKYQEALKAEEEYNKSKLEGPSARDYFLYATASAGAAQSGLILDPAITPEGIMEDRLKREEAAVKDLYATADNMFALEKNFLDDANNALTEAGVMPSTIEETVSRIESLKLEIEELKKTANPDQEAITNAEGLMQILLSHYEKLKEEGKIVVSGQTGQNQSDAQLEAERKAGEMLVELRRENDQAYIDAMQDGTQKKLAQIVHDYMEQKAEVDRQEAELRELNKKSGEKNVGDDGLTDEQRAELNQKRANIEQKTDKAIDEVYDSEFAAEEKAMNEYLKKYGDYQQKRQAIAEEYEQKIAAATNEWDKKLLEKERDSIFSDLDFEAAKTTSAISQLFGDMKNKTLKDLEEIAKRGEAALEFLKGGEWNEEQGIQLGISKEQFETLSKSPEKLEAISKALGNVKDKAEDLRNPLELVAEGLKEIFNSGDDASLIKGFENLQRGLQGMLKMIGFLSDSISELGESFGSDLMKNISEGLNVAMDTASSTLQGAQAGQSMGQGIAQLVGSTSSMFGPIGAAAGAAVGLVSSLASAIAKIHDKKNEKRIQDLQDRIDALGNSYDRLGKEIEKSYSTDTAKLYGKQNKMLEQQKKLIEQQIAEEEDKKDTDDDRIKQWKEELQDINDQIEENKEAALDAITGTDVMSAIDDFAQAYADAWASGTSAAKASTDVVKSLIKTSLLQFLKNQLSPTVEEFMGKLAEYMADGIIAPWEQAQLDKLKEEMDKTASEYYDNTSSYWDDSQQEQQSATRGFSTEMTQDQASELSGRFTAVAESNLRIEGRLTEVTGHLAIMSADVVGVRDIANDMRDIIANSYIELQQISENTGEIIKPIKQMQLDIAEVKRNTSRL